MVKRRQHNGFTLVEMSIIIAIVGLLVGYGIMMGGNIMDSFRVYQTREKLRILQKTLMDFRKVNMRLPCPALLTETIADATYGYEKDNGGIGSGGCTGNNLGASVGAIGMLPFNTLGLSEDMAYDGWGRRFTYNVAKLYTQFKAFDPGTFAITDNTNRLTVKAPVNDQNITQQAVYIIVSHGPNGHGGYTNKGVAVNVGSTNTYELANCNCNSSAVITNTSATMYVGEAVTSLTSYVNNFDDLGVFSVRSQIRGSDE